MVATRPRTADPYSDTAVIDARAPRFNQATVGLLSLIGLVTGWWWLYALLAAQLVLGLTLGRRWCLPCVAYFELVQPRLGEGPVEDARPPRFANQVGATFLTAATVAHLAGWPLLGQALGGVVAALALLAAATGLCVGCELYKLAARLRGVRPGGVGRIDLRDLDAESGGDQTTEGGPTLVHFTHPLCGQCRTVEEQLRADGRPLVTVDVSRRPELARRYRVAVVPTAYAVAPDGRVLERLA